MCFYTVLLYVYTLYKYQVKVMNTAANINFNNIIELHAQQRQQPGWHYLIAESVVFEKTATHSNIHAIRIQKPEEEQVPNWIKRLITSGNCETIYVENLNLPEEEQLTIRALCTQYSVSLVGLTVNDSIANNVVKGPW